MEHVEEKVLEREAARWVEIKWEEVKEVVCERLGLSAAAVKAASRNGSLCI